MARFVILDHDHPWQHWDLMLEVGNTLWTWRLASLPDDSEGEAERLPDHRLLYLEYEGPVSGKRGRVTRWDSGTFTWVEQSAQELVMELCGEKLRGRLLVRSPASQQGRVVFTTARATES